MSIHAIFFSIFLCEKNEIKTVNYLLCYQIVIKCCFFYLLLSLPNKNLTLSSLVLDYLVLHSCVSFEKTDLTPSFSNKEMILVVLGFLINTQVRELMYEIMIIICIIRIL